MINLLWAFMLLSSIFFAALQGNVGIVTQAIFQQAEAAIEVSIKLVAIIALWFGISRIAEDAGLMNGLARLLSPVLRVLFPGIPKGHAALTTISINLAANFLGLANAATPFGLKAMHDLQTINPHPRYASDDMITFLALNSAWITLVPSSAIALRAASGAADPAAIVIPAAMATGCSTIAVLILNQFLRRRFPCLPKGD